MAIVEANRQPLNLTMVHYFGGELPSFRIGLPLRTRRNSRLLASNLCQDTFESRLTSEMLHLNPFSG